MAMAKKTEDVTEAELQVEPTFLGDVAQLATLAEEAIRELRTKTHGDKFEFKDLSHLFPQRVGSIDYLGRLEKVVRVYLENTAISGSGSGADLRNGSAINANTSHFPWTVESWMKEVYTARKKEIDKKVEALITDVSNYANLKARDIAFELGEKAIGKDRFFNLVGKPNLNLDTLLADNVAELKTRMYRSELPHPEELSQLYELCFNAEVNQRGWLYLEDAPLIEVLRKENALELFQKYCPERMIKLLERDGGRTGISVVDNILVMPDRTPAVGGAIQSSSFTARDYIEAPSHFLALQALRTSYANGECPNQPTIPVNGQTYARPSTFYELLSAKVNDFHSKSNADGSAKEGEDPLRFFKVFLDTCTARHYKSGTTKFKLIPICPQLITLSAEPQLNYLNVPYSDSVGEERDNCNGKYGLDLSRGEVLEHQDWLFLANEDRALLGETFDIIKAACNGGANWKGMAFNINPAPQNDGLRPLCVNDYYYQGSANDRYYLHDHSRFLRR